MTSQGRLSATAIDTALAKSVLAALPPIVRDTLTHDALAVDLPTGTSLYYEADQPRYQSLSHRVADNVGGSAWADTHSSTKLS
jgi:hypothetical protein